MTAWTTASSQGMNCIEVADIDGKVAIRDTADPDRTVFTSRADWDVFLKGAKAGEFDGIGREPQRNGDYDWDSFRSQAYFEHNYREMRADDARILRIVRTWFREAVPAGARLSGIDVGPGANLAPAFALLPYCSDVTLYEYSAANVAWLERQLEDIDESWAPFALVASGLEWRMARFGLPTVARVEQGSIFELPKRRWTIGSMSFVAESLTEDLEEFEEAVGCFLGCLSPGSPFAAAFMEDSQGYDVDGVRFPAVPILGPQLIDLLVKLGASDVEVTRVEIDPRPIRPGYSGYLVATGRA